MTALEPTTPSLYQCLPCFPCANKTSPALQTVLWAQQSSKTCSSSPISWGSKRLRTVLLLRRKIKVPEGVRIWFLFLTNYYEPKEITWLLHYRRDAKLKTNSLNNLADPQLFSAKSILTYHDGLQLFYLIHRTVTVHSFHFFIYFFRLLPSLNRMLGQSVQAIEA